MKLLPFFYQISPIAGYNAIFNMIISGRSVGKTTQMTALIINLWKNKHLKSIIVKRFKTEIDEELVSNFLGEFKEVGYSYRLNKQSHIAYLVDDKGEEFCRFYALNRAKTKSIVILDIAYIFFDEFILDESKGQRYLRKEAQLFMELYGTISRGYKTGETRVFMFGNPWSLSNPYFQYFHINLKAEDAGSIRAFMFNNGDSQIKVAVEYFIPSPELRAFLESQPYFKLAKIDNDYFDYIMRGKPINDNQELIQPTMPNGCKYKFTLQLNDEQCHVYAFFNESKYWLYFTSRTPPKESIVFGFDLNENGAFLLTRNDVNYRTIKQCIRRRLYFIEKITYNQFVEALYRTL